MESSNLLFLYLVFPLSVLCYFLMPDMRRKNLVLLVISIVLYGLGQPLHMVFLVLMSYLNFKFALHIEPEDLSTVLLPVGINVGAFLAFRAVAVLLGQQWMFPAGLAFYMLSAISYFADVYERRHDPEEHFFTLLLYLLMFPKLLHGPVVRYEQMIVQIHRRRHSPRSVFEGFRRFLFGLAKKVLLADYCGRLLALVNESGADNTLVGVWFAAILFLFRVYYDFSGCCDMAVGLGRVFGFQYSENFKRPFLATSVTKFWNRWNVSLMSFARDYIYLPLGGNRLGKLRQILNMLALWLFIGLWYGLGVNYMIWAVYMFAVVTVERQFKSTLDYWPDWAGISLSQWLLLVGWIIFSHEDLGDLKLAFLGTLGYGDFGTVELGYLVLNSLPLLIVCFLGFTTFPLTVTQIFDGICGMSQRRENGNRVTPLRVVHLLVTLVVMAALLWLCTASMVRNPVLPTFCGGF